MKKLLGLSLAVLTLLVLTACTDTTGVAASTIAIDVNPSVVLELDENDKVINVILNNEDAVTIIGDMDLIGVDYNVAINALIGSMVANGYISELANSVLLSISSGDEVREAELIAELTQAVNDVLTGSQIDGSIIVQDLEFEADAEELAELLDISEAKAELILDIIEADPRMTVEELAVLSINDLNLLLESKNLVIDDLDKTGEASDLSLITVEEAYQFALTELGVDELLIVEFEVELEQEDGVMVYEVEIETDTEEYEILINAKDGSVYVEVEDDEDELEDDDFPVDALTEEEVINLLAVELGLDPALIVLEDFDQEVENGIAFYEVEFELGNVEYELEVDALTGEIYTNNMDQDGFDYEDDDDDEMDSEDEEDELDEEEDSETDDSTETAETTETDDSTETDESTNS